jgi:deoxyribonuclease-4
VDSAVDRALERGCTAFQMFTRNPRGWNYGKLSEDEVSAFRGKMRAQKSLEAVVHMPYLPNLASPKPDVYRISVNSLKTEVERSGMLGINYLVTHLGSHLGAGRKDGLANLTNAVSNAIDKVDNDVVILLENMAGTTNSMGSSFEDIREILDGVGRSTRVGVCFDTCHAFAAGYDMASEEAVNQTLTLFGEVVGWSRVKVVHLNDSFGCLACKRDRHEHVGKGYIGRKGFKAFLQKPEVRRLILILETPLEKEDDDVKNMAEVMRLAAP